MRRIGIYEKLLGVLSLVVGIHAAPVENEICFVRQASRIDGDNMRIKILYLVFLTWSAYSFELVKICDTESNFGNDSLNTANIIRIQESPESMGDISNTLPFYVENDTIKLFDNEKVSDFSYSDIVEMHKRVTKESGSSLWFNIYFSKYLYDSDAEWEMHVIKHLNNQDVQVLTIYDDDKTEKATLQGSYIWVSSWEGSTCISVRKSGSDNLEIWKLNNGQSRSSGSSDFTQVAETEYLRNNFVGVLSADKKTIRLKNYLGVEIKTVPVISEEK